MTVQELLNAAFRRMGAGRSATPDTNDYADLLAGLQSMLRFWATQGIVILATTQETIALSVGVSSYTWGVGGSIISPRPHSITHALARSADGFDSPVDIASETEFESIGNKTTTSAIPQKLFLRKAYPLAILNIWPVPSDGTYSLVLDCIKPFVEVGSFAALTDTIQLPTDYEAMVINNLAVWMAPEYGITPSATVVTIANDTYRAITGKNASDIVAPVILSDIIKLTGGGSFNINRG